MMENLLYYGHYGLLLLFGIIMSVIFAGIRLDLKVLLHMLAIFLLSAVMQLILLARLGEDAVWKLYPLITHIPIIVLLVLTYRRRISTALAAVTTAYLCCQIAKWLGLLAYSLTRDSFAELMVRIVILVQSFFLVRHYLAGSVSKIYTKDDKSVWIFGLVPLVYYLFDYITGIYTELLHSHHQTTVEFLPFVLCLTHLIFCSVYYKEYEQKADLERKDQMIHFTVEQQARELAALKRSYQELRILRHDMRLLLNNLTICMDTEDKETARKLIEGHLEAINHTVVIRYCQNDAVNYVLSDLSARCREQNVKLQVTVQIGQDLPDEAMFCSILANAFDNALNAQKQLPEEKRSIRLMLKTANGKLLLSLKNACAKPPVFVEGLPVSNQPGHGYGTQSIRYLTERLGGNCRFSVEEDTFILRIIL